MRQRPARPPRPGRWSHFWPGLIRPCRTENIGRSPFPPHITRAMSAYRFVKMHGIGNDFVVLDARQTPLSLAAAQVLGIGPVVPPSAITFECGSGAKSRHAKANLNTSRRRIALFICFLP